MIISASRRTDIPAFYADWFANRILAGFLLVRNPYNYNQISRISLLPEDVDAVVFWTRNPSKLIPYLDEFDSLGIRYYFQYTITGYPKLLDKHGLNPHKSLEVFSMLSEKISKNKIIWRYDPIILSNIITVQEHKRLFYKVAKGIAGKTNNVVISFADLYDKTIRNLNALSGFNYQDILQNKEALSELCCFFSQTAKEYDLKISTCAESVDLTQWDISQGKCIDDKLISDIFDIKVSCQKDNGQRDACGCVKSVDVGQYNTCMHGCAYCYATFNEKSVKNNFSKHDPNSPFIIGNADGIDKNILLSPIIQKSLF